MFAQRPSECDINRYQYKSQKFWPKRNLSLKNFALEKSIGISVKDFGLSLRLCLRNFGLKKVSVSVLMKILVSSLSGAQADAVTKDCSVTKFNVLFAHAHASLIGAASGTVQHVWPINQGVL